MEQLKYQSIASSLAQSMKLSHNNLFKITQLLVSLSLCSFIFSPSSLFVFLHYFKFYFSTIPFQLFTHNIDKNSMFLLCNGLLVFVGITRSFSSGGAGGNNDQQQQPSSKYVELDVVDANEPMLEELEVKEKSTCEHDEQNIDEAEQAIEVEENIERIILVDDEEQEQEENDDQETELFDGEDEEIDRFSSEENIEDSEDVEEENCMLSTEELNKKFDDFIRRMKEGLRIEAKSQFIMV